MKQVKLLAVVEDLLFANTKRSPDLQLEELKAKISHKYPKKLKEMTIKKSNHR